MASGNRPLCYRRRKQASRGKQIRYERQESSRIHRRKGTSLSEYILTSGIRRWPRNSLP
jgi:hypothetical protein